MTPINLRNMLEYYNPPFRSRVWKDVKHIFVDEECALREVANPYYRNPSLSGFLALRGACMGKVSKRMRSNFGKGY